MHSLMFLISDHGVSINYCACSIAISVAVQCLSDVYGGLEIDDADQQKEFGVPFSLQVSRGAVSLGCFLICTNWPHN